MGRNALAWHFIQYKVPDIYTCEFLYSVGEDVDQSLYSKLPKSLQFQTIKLQLKHICRRVIRKYLLEVDPHQHLFGRIPKLGLPSALSRYLLYNVDLQIMKHDRKGILGTYV